jgi:hypothetical protein
MAVPALLLAPDLLRQQHAAPDRPKAQRAETEPRLLPEENARSAASAPFPAGR